VQELGEGISWVLCRNVHLVVDIGASKGRGLPSVLAVAEAGVPGAPLCAWAFWEAGTPGFSVLSGGCGLVDKS